MASWTTVRTALALASCLGLLSPLPSTSAAGVVPKRTTAGGSTGVPRIGDVELAAGGTFRGQLVDRHAAPVRAAPVVISSAGWPVARGVTDAEGHFAVGRLQGGLYRVTAGGGSRLVRFWAPGTAPPGAEHAVRLVVGGRLVRGQSTRAVRFTSDAFLLGSMVAVGATIPLIIDSNRSDDRPGS